ncbi:MAG: SOS response-associated peptidase, partial [Planctomycetaceae bacterium]
MTDPNEALAALFGATPGNDLPEVPRYNVCPTNPVAVVTSDGGVRRLRVMRWGLVPSWAKDPSIGQRMINARAETLAEKPSFRTAFKRRRCLVPANGYYEWERTEQGKQAHYIRPRSGELLAMA